MKPIRKNILANQRAFVAFAALKTVRFKQRRTMYFKTNSLYSIFYTEPPAIIIKFILYSANINILRYMSFAGIIEVLDRCICRFLHYLKQARPLCAIIVGM